MFKSIQREFFQVRQIYSTGKKRIKQKFRVFFHSQTKQEMLLKEGRILRWINREKLCAINNRLQTRFYPEALRFDVTERVLPIAIIVKLTHFWVHTRSTQNLIYFLFNS